MRLGVELAESSAAATAAPVALSREPHIAPMVVLVDGITRSGKSMLCPVLSSFERVEIERAEEIIEYVGALHRMGKLEREVAVALLRMETDMHLYNSLIGRNTNFRVHDHSSVWKTPSPWRYLRRLFAPDGRTVLQRVAEERPIYQNHTHDQLANFALFEAAFGARLRMLHMIRHPVDLVDSWMRRGWGTRFGEDPLALTFCIRHEGRELPYYAIGWEAEYVASTPLGRVIRMIARLWEDNLRAYEALTGEQRLRVLIIPFEEFVQRPQPFLAPIAALLDARATRATATALRRERCPRPYSLEFRQRKHVQLERQAAQEERAMLARLIEEYEALVRAIGAFDG